MTINWTPISKPLSEAVTDQDVIVIGSGYGGGVAASRLARAGRRVTVLERGREVAPGDYPETAKDGLDEVQINPSTSERVGKRDGLFDFRLGETMNVFVGCGLGGTSLINANVALEADPRIFADWPEPFRSNPDLLAPYYDKARAMLGSKPYPADKTTPKLDAISQVAERLDLPFQRPPINVSFADGKNAAGIEQNACIDCGNCVTGCNVGAKNTVLMNYLPDAHGFGAKLFTGAEVKWIERAGDAWRVHVEDIQTETIRTLTAEVVVLAAGTLGSTEILLRSRDKGLALSPKLGARFSGNGDVWAFGYNASIKDDDGNRKPVHGVGGLNQDAQQSALVPGQRPGPCITGMVKFPDPNDVRKEIVVEEGAMPGALAAGYAAAFPPLAALMGDPFRFGDTKQRLEDAKDLGDRIAEDPFDLDKAAYSGPVARTLPFLVMAHDEAAGDIALTDYGVTVNWPEAGGDPAIISDDSAVRQACDAIEAEYLANPIWLDAFGNRLLSVHPLGGCPMADTVEEGVTDAACRVFDPAGGVHEGLYVCDGAVMPGPVGVNPHLLITAVAERAMDVLAKDRGWQISTALTPEAPAPVAAPKAEKPKDPVEVLARVIRGFEGLESDIERGCWLRSKYRLYRLWERVVEVYQKSVPDDLRADYPIASPLKVTRLLGTKAALREVTGPVLAQLLDVLRYVHRHLADKNISRAMEALEDALGDFTAPAAFEETMKGQLSAVGVDDDPPPSEPYKVAAHGGGVCTFNARIEAPTILDAIKPPDNSARIVSGKVRIDALGSTFDIEGEFRFLVENPDEIECWNMIYTGDLTDGDRHLKFLGKKTIQQREGGDWWSDFSVLNVDILDGETVIARGIIRIDFQDLAAQARDLEVAYGDLGKDWAAVHEMITDGDLGDLPTLTQRKDFRTPLARAGILAAEAMLPNFEVQKGLETAYRGAIFARMGSLALRSYGGIYSYVTNFPAKDKAPLLPPAPRLPEPEIYQPEPEPGVRLKLTRYKGGTRGPVVLAGGMGTKAISFAMPTIEENIAQTLTAAGYDVWLFDYRGSGAIEASQKPFTLDDVAQKDWPAAISVILEKTGGTSVQALVHCIGSMSLFMAVLFGESRVRSIISSQLGPHAITNWLNYAKGDAGLAGIMEKGLPKELWGLADFADLGEEMNEVLKHGLPVMDPCSPGSWDRSEAFDQAVDGAVWKIPMFSDVPCLSPTCHRISFTFGPSYHHAQLNQATHNAIADVFGPVSSHAFTHVGRIFAKGHPISADGSFDYMSGRDNLSMPVHFIAGGSNQEMLPEATLRSVEWLKDRDGIRPPNYYTRKVYPGYGHMDCFIGKNAGRDIFPDLRDKLAEQDALLAGGDAT